MPELIYTGSEHVAYPTLNITGVEPGQSRMVDDATAKALLATGQWEEPKDEDEPKKARAASEAPEAPKPAELKATDDKASAKAKADAD